MRAASTNPAPASDALSAIDRLALGRFPSPLNPLDARRGLWCKDDSALNPAYGGNKVRKLEYLLAESRRRGKRVLVCWGDAGSHTVAAAARLGTLGGFAVESVLYGRDGGDTPGPEAEALPGRVWRTPGFLSACLLARLRSLRPSVAYVPLGATTAVSTLGYVRAARELIDQWPASAGPLPARVYVALGSGGTAAGLAVGFSLAGVPSVVHGIQTVEAPVVTPRRVARIVRETLRLVGREAEAASCIDRHLRIDSRFLGRGYGDPTEASQRAVAAAQAWGLSLETAHTGKAMAALLHDLAQGASGPLLFWNSHHAVERGAA